MINAAAANVPAYPLEVLEEQAYPHFLSSLTSPPTNAPFVVPDFSAHGLPTAPEATWPTADDVEPDASEFDMAILAAAAANPAVADELAFLRNQTLNNFLIAVHSISASLSSDRSIVVKPSGSGYTADKGPIDVRSLRAASDGGASAARQQMELAEQLAIGALANLDNPNWDPSNPSNSVATDQNSLFAFLGA